MFFGEVYMHIKCVIRLFLFLYMISRGAVNALECQYVLVLLCAHYVSESYALIHPSPVDFLLSPNTYTLLSPV